MRNMLAIAVCLVTVLFCTVSSAYIIEMKEHIPSKYLLITFYGAEPEKPLDEKYMREIVNTAKFLGAAQLQIAVYDKGKKFGDGMRAILTRDEVGEKLLIAKNAQHSLKEESYLGYFVLSTALIFDFIEDDALASNLYKENTFLLGMTITSITQEDLESSYIERELKPKDIGFTASVKVRLHKDDPFLSKVVVGDTVVVRGKVTDFSEEIVILDGKIVNNLSRPLSE